MKKKFFNKSSQKGFTLLEMIVSLGIFTVVAVIAVGALIKVMDANKKSINLKNAINNLNFTLESMSREMRVGSGYYCDGSVGVINNGQYKIKSCPGSDNTINSGDWTIAFTSSKPNPGKNCNLIYAYVYDYDNTTQQGILSKGEQIPGGNCNDPISQYYPIISSNTKITSSIISVVSTGQPYATFFFKGTSGIKNKDKVDFAIQTSVSQRIK